MSIWLEKKVEENIFSYIHDVIEIYLKPSTSVPGATFAAPGTDVMGFR